VPAFGVAALAGAFVVAALLLSSCAGSNMGAGSTAASKTGSTAASGSTATGSTATGSTATGSTATGSTATGSTATGSTQPTIGADHECVVEGAGATPQVAWTQLRNPILSEPTAGVKDQALVWANGSWHMLFSYVTNDVSHPGAVHWDIATVTSPNLETWSAPSPWPAQAGVTGVASPDIVRSPAGVFVATYDSNPGSTDGGQSKLYYRTSTDLATWSAPQPLALSLHPGRGDRMIDPTLAWTGNGLILGYKYGIAPGTVSGAANGAANGAATGAATNTTSQHFEVAWSPSGSIDGPWTYVGRPDIVVDGDTVENLEFVAVSGHWRLVATSNTFDQPWIFELSGSPAVPSSWLHWTGGRMLEIPGQSWDSGPGVSSVGYEHANSVFLCDASAADGEYYVAYAGSDELTNFGGWGHAKIGIARSTDLVHWQVPG